MYVTNFFLFFCLTKSKTINTINKYIRREEKRNDSIRKRSKHMKLSHTRNHKSAHKNLYSFQNWTSVCPFCVCRHNKSDGFIYVEWQFPLKWNDLLTFDWMGKEGRIEKRDGALVIVYISKMSFVNRQTKTVKQFVYSFNLPKYNQMTVYTNHKWVIN